MKAILSDQIFDGQSVWVFVLLPGMIGFVAAIFLLQCLIWLEDWLPELPWQRQRLPWEDPVPTIFDRFAIWVERIRARIARLSRAVIQRTGSHPPVFPVASTESEVAHQKPKPLALSFFGVQEGSNLRTYLWSEKDEID